jgi:hypothetical protein
MLVPGPALSFFFVYLFFFVVVLAVSNHGVSKTCLGFFHNVQTRHERSQRSSLSVTPRFASENDDETDQNVIMEDAVPQTDGGVVVLGHSHASAAFAVVGSMVTAGGFWQRMAELQEFQRRFGHCQVPKRYPENPSLGNFVNKQRQLYRHYQKGLPSSLTTERIAMLDALGFCWQVATAAVPATSTDPNDSKKLDGSIVKLATKLKPLDSSRKEASSVSLITPVNTTDGGSQHTRRQPELDTKSPYEEKWWKRFHDFKAHLHANNITDLATIPSSSAWGVWLNTQRTEYWKRSSSQQQEHDADADEDDKANVELSSSLSPSSRLTHDMIQALEELQMDWNHRRQQIWELRLRELRDYQQEYGDTCVPITYTANPALAQWTSRQRKNYNAKKRGCVNALTQERIEQLDALGFVWNRWDYEFSIKTTRKKKTPQ